MRRITIFCGLIVLTVFLACNSNKLSPLKYLKYVEDPKNGLVKTAEVGNYVFQLQYCPYDYKIVQELKKDKITKEERATFIKQLGELDYYLLRITFKDAGKISKKIDIKNGNKPIKDTVSEYLTFKFQSDLKSLEGKDSLPCVLYLYERTEGLTPYNSVVMAFDRKDKMVSNRTIVINSKKLGIESLQFVIKEEDLKKIPELKTK